MAFSLYELLQVGIFVGSLFSSAFLGDLLAELALSIVPLGLDLSDFTGPDLVELRLILFWLDFLFVMLLILIIQFKFFIILQQIILILNLLVTLSALYSIHNIQLLRVLIETFLRANLQLLILFKL